MRWIALLAGLVVIVGCGKVVEDQPTSASKAAGLVGVWRSEFKVAKSSDTATSEFKADGTFTTTVDSIGKERMTVTQVGTWKLVGNDQLQLHVDDITLKVDTKKPIMAQVLENFKKQKAKLIEQTNAHATEQITWQGSDGFSYKTQQGQSRVFKRVR